MATARTRRIDALLQEEISELLRREVQDPRVGFVTITDVDTSPDLGHARVWVSVMGSEADRQSTMRGLERAMPFVRRRLGERLRLKRIPELIIRDDRTVERGTRVMHILQELEEGRTPHELADTLPAPTPAPAAKPKRAPKASKGRPRRAR